MSPCYIRSSIKLVADEGLGDCQLTVLLVDEATCAQLHHDHFDDSSITDVMSFPDGSEDPGSGMMLLGDLAVCPAVASEASNPTWQYRRTRNHPIHHSRPPTLTGVR